MTTRRDMLKTTAVLGTAALFGTQLNSGKVSAQEISYQYDPNTIYSSLLGWRIGPQIYSFKNFPFDEAIKKVKQTGAMSFELYRGQLLTKGSDVKVGPGMSKDDVKRFKELCAEAGCVPHAMGVCAADRAHAEFALEVGISNINVEPKPELLPEVNKLADEYNLNIGLHNHPTPSVYWDPKFVAKNLADCGPRVGACCDTGHWVRSGLDPIECLKILKGRILSFHIKDLDPAKKGEDGRYRGGDIALGKGVCKIEEVLKECVAQGVRGPFSIEYESDWDNNVGHVTESVKFFNEVAKKIVLGS